VGLLKWLIVPGEESLEGLLDCLLAMEESIFRRWRIGSQIDARAAEVV
jgi:hypothetical protein